MKNFKRILSIALAALLMLSLTACSASDYKAAGALYQAGDYKAAAEKYAALGDYKDSAELAVKSVYDFAVETFQTDKYAESIELFLQVEDYQDSEDYITRAREAIVRQSVLGEWKCDLDVSAEYAESFSDGFSLTNDSDPSEYFDFSGASVRYLLTLNEDDTYILDVDKAAYDESLKVIGEKLKSGMVKMIEDEVMAEAEAAGFTMDDLLAELGVESITDLINMVFQSEFGMDLDGFIEFVMSTGGAEEEYADYPKTGSFTVSGTTVTLTEDEVTAEYNAIQELLTAAIPVSDSVFQTLEFAR